MPIRVDLALQDGIAALEPRRNGLAKSGDAPDWRVAAEFAHMVLERRAEERRHESLRFAERQIDGRFAGRNPVK